MTKITKSYFAPKPPKGVKSKKSLKARRLDIYIDKHNKKTSKKNSKLGQGCFGSAYKVKTKTDGGIYVVKIIKYTKKALSEAIMLRLLPQNPYIIKYFNSRHDNKYIRLYLEVVGNGLDLSKKLSISINDKKRVIYQICLGLKHIHNFNILHRDLKSSNILIVNENPIHIKLNDFGISCLENGQEKDKSICYGDIRYSPPEIFKKETYSKSSDIYSVGCIAAELVSHYSVNELNDGINDAWFKHHDFTEIVETLGEDIVDPVLNNILLNTLLKSKNERYKIEKIINLLELSVGIGNSNSYKLLERPFTR